MTVLFVTWSLGYVNMIKLLGKIGVSDHIFQVWYLLFDLPHVWWNIVRGALTFAASALRGLMVRNWFLLRLVLGAQELTFKPFKRSTKTPTVVQLIINLFLFHESLFRQSIWINLIEITCVFELCCCIYIWPLTTLSER